MKNRLPDLGLLLSSHRIPEFSEDSFWTIWSTPKKFPYDYLLYGDDGVDSKITEKILKDLGCKFKFIESENTTCWCGQMHQFPILVEVRRGPHEKWLAFHSLKHVRHHLRYVAMKNWHDYNPHIRTSIGNVACFDLNGDLISNVEISQAQFPVKEMLEPSWFVKRCGLKAFHELTVWHYGPLKYICRNQLDKNGNIISTKPPIAIFADEIDERFKKGEKYIISDDHGCMYCVSYDAYFVIKGDLYRILGSMVD